jgi:transposase
MILLEVVTHVAEVLCPLCQRPSERVHSRYRRKVADLPWANCAVEVRLHVRRFFVTTVLAHV